MGLLDLILGPNNGISRYVDTNKNAVHGAFAGFGQGTNIGDGFGYAARGAAAGAPADDIAAASLAADAARQKQITDTTKYLQAKFPDLAAAVSSGLPLSDAWNEAMKRSQPGYGDPNWGKDSGFSLNPGESRFDAAGNVIAALPAADKAPSPPVGYQPRPDGSGLTFIPGGPADPATAGKTTEATRRNQQLAKVIEPELDSLLGSNGNPGTFDALTNGWSQTLDALGPVGLAMGGGPAQEYQQAKNSLKTIIASYLYSVSGATANPGEVETQASVLTPKPGEPAASVADKKRRIQTMVQAVKDAAKGTPIDPSVQDSPAPSGKVLTYNPTTGELE